MRIKKQWQGIQSYRHMTSPLPHTYQYLDTRLQSVHHTQDRPSKNVCLHNECDMLGIRYFCKIRALSLLSDNNTLFYDLETKLNCKYYLLKLIVTQFQRKMAPAIIPQSHRFVNAVSTEPVQTFHNCPCLPDNTCQIERLDSMVYCHLTKNDANQAIKFSDFKDVNYCI